MVCVHFSNQGQNLFLELMARIVILEKYEDQIQIVIQRLHIDIPKLKRLLKWNSNANHRKTAKYD